MSIGEILWAFLLSEPT